MPRIRTIKPEFWEDEKLASLPMNCRLFYIGTWNFADDFGVIKGNATLLKSQIFPYDEDLRVAELKKWIDALVKARMLIPISHNGESYYVIRTFRSHQILDKRYEKSHFGNKELANTLISSILDEQKTTAMTSMPPPQETHIVTTASSHSDHGAGKGRGKGSGEEVEGGVGGTDDGGLAASLSLSGNSDDNPVGDPTVGTPPVEPSPGSGVPPPKTTNFQKFQDWITQNAPRVAKLKEPFTEAEFERVRQDFDLKFIQELLIKMHNWKPLLNKNLSANLTFRGWASRELNTSPNGKTNTNGRTSDRLIIPKKGNYADRK